MNELPAPSPAPASPAFSRRAVFAGVALLLLSAAGIAIILAVARTERDRALQVWQTQLGIIADSRAADVESWLARQFDDLTSLAENAALQLYLSELNRPEGQGAASDRAAADLARSGYLRNLLTVVAHRAGYDRPADGPAVDANVRRIAVAGLALVGLDGRVFAATDAMPPIEGGLAEFLRGAARGRQALLDLHRDATGAPAMGFAVPVFAVQGDATPASQVGWVVGIKQVAAELYPLLRQPGAVWRTAEALLVRRDGQAVTYLSPTRAGDRPMERSFAADTPDLAAAFALDAPGGFDIRRDYRGEDVLVAPRRISRAPWTLLYKVDRAEALGPEEARIRRLIVLLVLGLAATAAAAAAVWRHTSSRRAERLAGDNAAMAARFAGQSRFLRLVTDSQPGAMFIVDGDDRLRYANRAAAEIMGLSEAELVGKSLASVIGPAAAERYERLNREVMTTGTPRQQVHRSGANGDLKIVQTDHIPVSGELEPGPGVMVVEVDITAAVAERERRERTLKQLVTTLVGLIDRRDPHAADHSERVAQVARAIAEEMGLDETFARTAELAGRLMNLGKLLVPPEMLTRAATLDDIEVRQIRDGLLHGAELIAGVDFDGPVVETLRQIGERWDGTGGPVGLAGGEILITAQIVAVANAFVALTSERAWRSGVEAADAVGRLFAEGDGAYARRVLSALANLVDNRGLAPATPPPEDRPALH